METAPQVSVVIPVYNEAANLTELLTRVADTLRRYGRSFEIVAVDDGSTDNGLEILKQFRAKEPRLRIVRLLRNFGQTPALYAGFSYVLGETVVSLDADLQNPPEEMTKLLDKLDEGYDAVQGWRENRRDSLLRRIPSKLLNAVVSRTLGAEITDLGCGLKAFRRPVVDQMLRFTHHSRYLPAEVYWLGVKIGEVRVEHRERAGGKSKYGLLSLLRLNFDMISSITTAPVKFIGVAGILFSIIGFGMATRIGIMRLVYGNWDNMATVTALFFFLAGIQMVGIGLACEYISRIFVEVQGKPYFIVKETLE